MYTSSYIQDVTYVIISREGGGVPRRLEYIRPPNQKILSWAFFFSSDRFVADPKYRSNFWKHAIWKAPSKSGEKPFFALFSPNTKRCSRYCKLHSVVSRSKCVYVGGIFKLLADLIDVRVPKFCRRILSGTRHNWEKISTSLPKPNTRLRSYTWRASSNFIAPSACVPRSSAHHLLFRHVARG